MNTFMLKKPNLHFTPVDNVFIDKYMVKARGEFVKIYLLTLKYVFTGEEAVSSQILANNLNLLESDILNAWNYWHDEEVIKLIPLDNYGNYSIEFLNLRDQNNTSTNDLNLLQELRKNNTREMLQEIEQLLGRTLSPNEMSLYISWNKDYSFSPELILLLIQYSISKGKSDYRYFEKVAISWHDANIRTIDEAQSHIKKYEDKMNVYRQILNYLGIKNNGDIMKPQEEMLNKWVNIYKFPLDIIYKACDICFERINKLDFKYMDSILNSWNKSGYKTLEEVLLNNSKKQNYKPKQQITNSNFNNFNQGNYDYDYIERKLLGWDDND